MPHRFGDLYENGYRYGFQDQEKDNEIKGNGNSLNYSFRMHDPRVGRFFAVDPLFRKYAYNSPYAFSENRVIDGVELEGLEVKTVKTKYLPGAMSSEDITRIHVAQTMIDWSKLNNGKNTAVYQKQIKDVYAKYYKPALNVSNDRDIKMESITSSTIIYGESVSTAFAEKVVAISNRLDIDPNYLMAVMAFESGLSPTAKNPGSTATGLIQFMEATAKKLDTTTDKLKAMSAEDQLDYVEKYFGCYKGKLKTLEDTYMAVLYPKAIGKSNDYALFTKGDENTGEAYEVNSGLDTDRNGIVTKKEAAAKVREKLEKGKTKPKT